MSLINKSIKVNKFMVKNRIIMAPLLCFNWADEDGFEIYDRSVHYGKRARGGTGLIIIEASAISKDARINETELGLWKDEHIPQFNRIAKSCHNEDSLVIVQLVHAGMNGTGTPVLSSSPVKVKGKECFEMSLEEMQKTKKDFVSAALRAKKAGLDGVEIHGAHGYLLNQFTSKEINQRTDMYGGTLENRLRLPLEIVDEIRAAAGDAFIISYRLGVNDPSLQEDNYLARKLEDAGVDILNVSAGIGSNNIIVPDDFPFSKITYMGTELYKKVNIPVACVFGIREPNQAEYLLKHNMIDMVAVGRGQLADPEWTNKAIQGDAVNVCCQCPRLCMYIIDGRNCPWYGKE
ncbi:oxidoreductase [Alkaliphilus peptidifermentans]|uniref:2,4-dienoyl-CoA reductase n=1 Tax=Alkaliphilus peptidifermentans DSM 18978 TaxID=1120976 RepID=A0A1G5K6W4_9FIRM|nr:NADH:flavin oxidoreductase [Alkaliphilus peptidifermentans]SCY96336.1 2,4-dienoyl-CoA reductase [Alkaliphilus peptidifermentans DSM 18978]